MLTNNSLKLTSTPFELLQDSADSGYNSILSCLESSCSIVPESKSEIQFSTPQNFLTADSGVESNERSRNEQLKLTSSKVHYKCIQSCLIGREYVDFLYYLGKRNDYLLIVKQIFNFLDDNDLYNVAAVSQCWKNVVLSIPNERKRFRQHLRKSESNKENRVAFRVFEDKTYHSPRPILVGIENIAENLTSSNSSSSSVSTPVPHSSCFEAYLKEAPKVKSGKRLYKCPKCGLPSHVDEKLTNAAECTNANCKYRFCIQCQDNEHETRTCYFICTPKTRKESAHIGSFKSKKNLRRLLL